jgi:hypothetical protein
MKHLKRFNESIDEQITFGSIVKYKNSPSDRYLNSEFIVKVDGEYNDWSKGDWVIMYEVKPNLSDLEIQEIMDCKVPTSRSSSDADWYKLNTIVNFLPIREPKWKLIKVK